jgi:hypothetical protein
MGKDSVLSRSFHEMMSFSKSFIAIRIVKSFASLVDFSNLCRLDVGMPV